MEGIILVIILVAGLAIGGFIGYYFRKLSATRQVDSAERKAEELLNEAKSKQKEILLEAKDKALASLDEAKKEAQKEGVKSNTFNKGWKEEKAPLIKNF